MLIATEDGVQQDRIVGGSQGISLALADGLDECPSTPVQTFGWGEECVVVDGRPRRRTRPSPSRFAPASRIRYPPALPHVRVS